MSAIVAASKMKRWPLSDLNKDTTNLKNMYYNYFGTVSDSTIASYMGVSAEEFQQNIANQAGKNLKQDLILYQIAKENGLTKVTDGDLKEYAEGLYASYGYDSADEFIKNYGKATLKKQLVIQRGAEKLTELVTVTD